MYTTNVVFDPKKITGSGLFVLFLSEQMEGSARKISPNSAVTIISSDERRVSLQKDFPWFNIGGGFSPLWGSRKVYGVSREFLKQHQLPHITSSADLPCVEDMVLITDTPRSSRIFKRLVPQARSNGFRYVGTPNGFFFIEGPTVVKANMPINGFNILL